MRIVGALILDSWLTTSLIQQIRCIRHSVLKGCFSLTPPLPERRPSMPAVPAASSSLVGKIGPDGGAGSKHQASKRQRAPTLWASGEVCHGRIADPALSHCVGIAPELQHSYLFTRHTHETLSCRHMEDNWSKLVILGTPLRNSPPPDTCPSPTSPKSRQARTEYFSRIRKQTNKLLSSGYSARRTNLDGLHMCNHFPPMFGLDSREKLSYSSPFSRRNLLTVDQPPQPSPSYGIFPPSGT
ncbi:hypothetical protein BDP55DRAFT_414367 [Colletotrichum godetiae]|uniref:Uncharacterized protein n=1 Tax=Colletotrichum godetiae TaxID=1209918 RepID=A0AAJ0A7M8_9PEZI|nr:uncharacterized protein BDP55DRAFT_414367 [Colletotrichum godetiae]KAK1657980.1 hypothetical protein BDP55DRAFT_414367 [Colletotrichum godetiae]